MMCKAWPEAMSWAGPNWGPWKGFGLACSEGQARGPELGCLATAFWWEKMCWVADELYSFFGHCLPHFSSICLYCCPGSLSPMLITTLYGISFIYVHMCLPFCSSTCIIANLKYFHNGCDCMNLIALNFCSINLPSHRPADSQLELTVILNHCRHHLPQISAPSCLFHIQHLSHLFHIHCPFYLFAITPFAFVTSFTLITSLHPIWALWKPSNIYIIQAHH